MPDEQLAKQVADLVAILNELHIRVDELAKEVSENTSKINELSNRLLIDWDC